MLVKYCSSCGAKNQGLGVNYCCKCGSNINIATDRVSKSEKILVRKRNDDFDDEDDEMIDNLDIDDVDDLGATVRGQPPGHRVSFKSVAAIKPKSEKGKTKRRESSYSAEDLLKRSIKYSRDNPIDIE